MQKQKEVEQIAMPIITKLYQAAGGAAGAGGMPDFGGEGMPDFGQSADDARPAGKGPKIEEVD